MSKLDLALRSWVIILKVQQILERRANGPSDLPEVDILDDQGKKHTISAVELSQAEFEKIQPGVLIHIRIQENWINMMVLS